MKKTAGILLCAILLIAAVGCDKSTDPTSPNAAVVGTWEGPLPSTNFTTVFNTNGTVTGTAMDLINGFAALGGGSASATYNATELRVTIRQPGEADDIQVSTYSVNGDTLVVTDSDNEIEKWRRKE